MTIQHRFTVRRAIAAALFVSAMAAASGASASPTASGKAFDMDISVSLLGIPLLTITQQDLVEFSNLAIAFQDSKNEPGFSTGDPLTVSISTDELVTATQWLPGDTFFAVGSNASVSNIDLSALNVGASVLSVAATQVQSTAIIEGSCPATVTSAKRMSQANQDVVGDVVYENQFELQNLIATKQIDIPGLEIDILGNPILSIPANPAANTSIGLNSTTGLTVITGTLLLNKQTTSGDGISSLSTGVDGVLLDVSATVASMPLLSAHVDLSHTEASINCN